ncbi:hypothetical protein KQI49_03245 [Virgibacillus sp. MSJ-26]|uniref:hypothetical protein n=1 Tax=Virgibacillus sp. MSJ-26 TaxID=2841522 RepID=UPI001C103E6C|nr:hypothetical protein [Virgibacillus sp. MSJ-26]MBU5465843.1 hypothetical protein [Virgibacillus sp. MSJ-26]
MKLYSTGMIALLASVAALVANLQRGEGFNHTNPYLFWGLQTIFIILFVLAILYTMLHWKQVGELTKNRFFTSIIICGFIYAIAYIDFRYSFLLIFVCGVAESYLTRKRAGFVKSKN